MSFRPEGENFSNYSYPPCIGAKLALRSFLLLTVVRNDIACEGMVVKAGIFSKNIFSFWLPAQNPQVKTGIFSKNDFPDSLLTISHSPFDTI
jgi:hypothetical protein